MRRSTSCRSESISTDSIGAAASPPDRPFTVGYLARIAPEKGLLGLCEAYVRFRQMPGVASARLDVAGYLAPDQQNYLEDAKRRLTNAGFGGEFHVSRRARPRAEDRFSQGPRRVLSSDGVRRAERTVPARGDGVRRAGRAAAPRRVSRDARKDIWRHPRRAGRCAESCRRALQTVEGSGAARRAGTERHSTACASTTASSRSADRMLEVYEGVACLSVKRRRQIVSRRRRARCRSCLMSR